MIPVSDRVHFWMISLIHWHLFKLFVNPYEVLGKAGLGQGQRVLEIGCGPGFFTTAASRIVGEKGRVYALDMNPAAIEDVQHKIEERGLTNVETILADASKTGLPDQSIDVAFLFGVIHALDDVNAVMREMHRVLKKRGILTVKESRRRSEKQPLRVVTDNNLFLLKEKTDNLFKFSKIP
jgi:ubiquinone/menaquinone biosynthesis C-methylase UbiE